jgi:hypothetical protein
MNREALEDAVYDLYPSIEMYQIEKMEIGKLQWMLDLKQGKYQSPASKPQTVKQSKPVTICEKIGSTYEIRDGELVHVETWRTSNAAGQTIREYLRQPGARVLFEGRTVSASLLKHYLLTGEMVSRVPKPRKPYRAQIRKGARVIYLGRYATIEDRDAAIFAYKLGIFHPAGEINCK